MENEKLPAKIALFVPSLRGGGAERVMLTLAREFILRGVEVDLVLNKAEGPYLSELPSDMKVIDLNAPRLLAGIPKLMRYLRQERPPVLLSAMKHANVIALLSVYLSGVGTRVVVSEHNAASVSLQQSSGIKSLVLRKLMIFLYRKSWKVVAVSHGVARDLSELLSLNMDHIKTIYNPIVDSAISIKANEFLDHRFFNDEATPVLCAVGRLSPQKDLGTLIRAFAIVRQQRACRLLILGDGDEKTRLEVLIASLGLENDVLLQGFVSNPYQYMKRSAMLVLSSRWEGFGNVLVEAMACGVPVVSTDCPSGPAEILDNGRWGRLVPVGDVEAMAHAILLTLDDPVPPLYERAEVFSIEKSVDTYLGLLFPEFKR